MNFINGTLVDVNFGDDNSEMTTSAVSTTALNEELANMRVELRAAQKQLALAHRNYAADIDR